MKNLIFGIALVAVGMVALGGGAVARNVGGHGGHGGAGPGWPTPSASPTVCTRLCNIGDPYPCCGP